MGDALNGTLLEAAREALEFFEQAPIDELEAVEDAIGMNAPIGKLQNAILEAETAREHVEKQCAGAEAGGGR